MSVNEALRNKKIVTCIMRRLAVHDDDGLTKESSRALASVARLSKRLSCPALDALWKSMPTLLPLLRVLETIVKANIPAGSSSSAGTVLPIDMMDALEDLLAARIKCSLPAPDLSRFRVYAARIHSLHSIDLQKEGVAAGLVSRLRRLLGGSPFLPSLAVLSWMHPADNTRQREGMDQDLLALIPLTLRELRIRPAPPRAPFVIDKDAPITLSHVMRSLPAQAPHLQNLDLNDVAVSMNDLGALSGIPELRHIRLSRLQTKPSAKSVLDLFAGQQDLRSLILYADWPEMSLVPSSEDKVQVFTSLQQLRINGDGVPLPALGHVLSGYQMRRLTALHLPSVKIPAGTSIRAIHGRLNTLAALGLLDLELQLTAEGTPDYRDNFTFLDYVRPLLKLSRLRRVRISVDASLTVESVQAMARSWRQLETICLLASPRRPVSTTVLGHLVGKCRELVNVLILGCPMLPPTVEDVRAMPATNHKLFGTIAFQLDAAQAQPADVNSEDIKRRCRYILQMCPRVTHIVHKDFSKGETKDPFGGGMRRVDSGVYLMK